MKALRIFFSIIRFVIRLLLLPIQAALTIIMMMFNFAGGVFNWLFGIIGAVCIIGGICGLILPPADWKTFWESITIGSLLGIFPRIVAACLNGAVYGLKKLIDIV